MHSVLGRRWFGVPSVTAEGQPGSWFLVDSLLIALQTGPGDQMFGWARENPGCKIGRNPLGSILPAGSVVVIRSSLDVEAAVALAVPWNSRYMLDLAAPDRDDYLARDWIGWVKAAQKNVERTVCWFARAGPMDKPPSGPEGAGDGSRLTSQMRGKADVIEAGDDSMSRSEIGTLAPTIPNFPTVNLMILVVRAVAESRC